MGAFEEYIKSAFASIKSNKGRSILTMLGIIIGIFAVLVIIILGDGFEASMRNELNKGALVVKVKVDATKTDKFITREKIKLIEEAFSGQIIGINYLYNSYVDVESLRGDYLSYSEQAGGTAYKQAENIKMISGRFYNEDDIYDCNLVCVLTPKGAKRIFGHSDVIGDIMKVHIEDKVYEYTVIGIREAGQNDKLSESYDNYFIYMPFTSALYADGVNPDEKITSVDIVVDPDHLDVVYAKAASVVENILEIRGEKAVKASVPYDGAFMEEIMKMIKPVILLVAAISLVVGGIGVMNIMTVSVTERTREIGIRKSIGARTSSVMIQFLAEASILTFSGGFIGVVLGLVMSYAMCKMLEFPYVVDPKAITSVVGLSIFIGLFFGINPARKAAKLKPIDALRTN
jgi:putative ABC transport system permease protein